MKRVFLEDVLKTVSRVFLVLVIVVVICIAFSGVRIVKSGEVALVLRFGKLVGDTRDEQIHEAGLMFCFPSFIDEVITVSTDTVMQQDIRTHLNEESWGDGGYFITGDNNIVLVNAMVKYKVSDPVSYALQMNEIDSIIDSVVRGTMMRTAANTSGDAILTSGKKEYEQTIFQTAQTQLDTLQTGIALQALELTSVTMPKAVKGYYEQLNAATIEAATLMEEAELYKSTVLPGAEATAQELLSEANQAHASSISTAQSNLVEFWGVLEEYNQDPEVVRTRLYNSKLSLILDNMGSIRVVQADDSVIIIRP